MGKFSLIEITLSLVDLGVTISLIPMLLSSTSEVFTVVHIFIVSVVGLIDGVSTVANEYEHPELIDE